ncbi:MAG TPA: hypothetical protein PKD85_04035 [Saprospiraceae bacterium]|nr:hypothetical protein [Saprospiraceae bacterium]
MAIEDIISASKMRHQRHCRMCKEPFSGRSDKIFCSATCKASYHVSLNKVTNQATEPIDKILHRNRSTLLEILGKNALSKKVDKVLLDEKKFNYSYVTGYHINSKGKMVNVVYDFTWIIFSDQEILIKKIRP